MGAFKLGKMTFGSLFKKPETLLYPVEKKPQPEGLKGHIALDVKTCILCGMCGRSCPTDCIAVDKQERTWAIDRFACIQCGYCITVCPKNSLTMDPNYAPAAVKAEKDVIEVPDEQARAESKSEENDLQESVEQQEATVKDAGKEPASTELPAQPAKRDAILEAKIAIMDPEKAEKVRKALEAR